jgi:aminoglycoside phosphotransferase (APT) family kinase protein
VTESVERAIAPLLPPNCTSVSVTPITTGKFNTSFFVTGDAVDWVVRVAPPRDAVFIFYECDMMRQEPGIHARLLDHTTVPVPPVVHYDDSLTRLDRDYIVMERLQGRPISDVSCNYAQVLGQVGDFLAQTHAQIADTYGYIGEHHPMLPQTRWVDAFHIMWNRLIDGIVAVGHYDEEESRTFRDLLDQHIQIFDRDIASSLLHMDVWAENILVDDSSRVTGLIDWDRALWGDPEIEYAVLDYCGISEPAFWEGYGKTRDQSSEAMTRQVFYLLYELQKYIIIRQGRGNDPVRARQYKQQVYEILKNSGLS